MVSGNAQGKEDHLKFFADSQKYSVWSDFLTSLTADSMSSLIVSILSPLQAVKLKWADFKLLWIS